MTDYISRASIGLTDFEIILCQADENKYKSALVMLLDKIEKLPAADVRENKRGEWEERKDLNDVYWECSVCGEAIDTFDGESPYRQDWNYCPNCGSEMREEDNETVQ